MKKLFLFGEAEKYTNYINAFRALDVQVVATCDDSVAHECDALLLPGGGDVNPALYGAIANGSYPPDDTRDNGEMRTIARFLAAERPILGICRGLQILNVAFGGTLLQHIDNHNRVTPDLDRVHLTTADDPFLTDIYGKKFFVNSAHHQVVDQLGTGLQAMQWSEDGFIEAFRHTSRPIFAVQWHPERMCFALKRDDTVDGSAILRAFLSYVN